MRRLFVLILGGNFICLRHMRLWSGPPFIIYMVNVLDKYTSPVIDARGRLDLAVGYERFVNC